MSSSQELEPIAENTKQPQKSGTFNSELTKEENCIKTSVISTGGTAFLTPTGTGTSNNAYDVAKNVEEEDDIKVTDVVVLESTAAQESSQHEAQEATSIEVPNENQSSSVVQNGGSVQKTRQKFLSASSVSESTSFPPFEKSLDNTKKVGSIDDNDSRNVAIVLDINEKSWYISTAQGDMVAMRRLLDTETELAEKKDFIVGYNGIHWAAKKGNVDMLRMVLEHNKDVNLKTNGGYTPLHLAAMGGHEQCISLLLDYGADVNVRDYSGRKPISYLKVPENDENEISVIDENEVDDNQIPKWQRHSYSGMNFVPPASVDVYDRVEIKMITSKLDNDVVRRRQSENTASVPAPDRKQRSKSTVFSDRKNSLNDVASKPSKPSRKDSNRGLWKLPSLRRQKAPSVSSIEHQMSLGTPQALPHVAAAGGWKPAGPKT